jgi:hypothetical protein
MSRASAWRRWLGPVLALLAFASISNCGRQTSGPSHQGGAAAAGAPSPTMGGTPPRGMPPSSAGTAVGGASAVVGPAPGDAGTGGTVTEGGGPFVEAGGAGACDAPDAPDCVSCCAPNVCPPDTANCDTEPDCETAFGANDTCTPELATVGLPTYGNPIVNADGSYFIFGPFLVPTDFDPGPAEDLRTPVSNDAYISKFSTSGDYLWTYTFGRSVYSFNVASGADGRAVVAGSFERFHDPDESGGVYTDAFIMQLGADGQPAWKHVFDAISQYAAGTARVATDSAGTAILSAIFRGDVDLDPGSGVDAQHFGEVGQGYLFELDVTGSMAWRRAIGDEKCYFSALSLAVSREVIAVTPSVGIDCVIDGKPLGTRLRNGYLPFATFTREGVLREAWLLGGVRRISDPLAYDDGSVVVSGMFINELRLGESGEVIAVGTQQGSDFMLRFSPSSRVEWAKVFPTSGQLGDSIARTPDGGVLGTLRFDGTIAGKRYLVSWKADGSPAWSGALECSTSPVIASNGDWFMLKTDAFNSGACDLEPGATEEPAEDMPYLVRYHF